jgi:adenylate kinase
LERFIVEIGMGVDFHGQDVTKAAVKAAKDAISRSCLVGLNEVCGFTQETVENRINVYREQTEPLIDYYTKKGIIVNIDGEKPIAQVGQDIIAQLRK